MRTPRPDRRSAGGSTTTTAISAIYSALHPVLQCVEGVREMPRTPSPIAVAGRGSTPGSPAGSMSACRRGLRVLRQLHRVRPPALPCSPASTSCGRRASGRITATVTTTIGPYAASLHLERPCRKPDREGPHRSTIASATATFRQDIRLRVSSKKKKKKKRNAPGREPEYSVISDSRPV